MAGIAAALGEPNRIKALAMLRRGELCVCDLTEGLALSQSTVSNHMAILKRAGLVESRKDGRWMHFRITDADDASIQGQALRWILANLPKAGLPVTCRKATCCP